MASVSTKTVWINMKTYPVCWKVMGVLSTDNRRLIEYRIMHRRWCHLHYSLRGQVNSEYGLKKASIRPFWRKAFEILFILTSPRTLQLDFHKKRKEYFAAKFNESFFLPFIPSVSWKLSCHGASDWMNTHPVAKRKARMHWLM
jgi:hypothetical protein